MKRSGVLALFPLLAFAGLALALGKGVNQPAEPAFVGQLDRPLPEFDLSPLPGTESGFSSQDLEGKVVLINVFASWCSVCRAEHDKLLDLAASQPVPVYGVNWKDAKGAGTLFLNRFGNPYVATGDDPAGVLGSQLGVTGVPETLVIDADGRIRYRHLGELTDEVWTGILQPLLSGLEAES